jgi:hypothetical protein
MNSQVTFDKYSTEYGEIVEYLSTFDKRGAETTIRRLGTTICSANSHYDIEDRWLDRVLTPVDIILGILLSNGFIDTLSQEWHISRWYVELDPC